jgi:hypothetical protein
MKNYSIVRIGNEYVVQADEKSVLKIASRRRAARLVNEAAELLDSHPAEPLSSAPSHQSTVIRGSYPIPGITADPEPDPSEVP